jgi:hypothetical protein
MSKLTLGKLRGWHLESSARYRRAAFIARKRGEISRLKYYTELADWHKEAAALCQAAKAPSSQDSHFRDSLKDVSSKAKALTKVLNNIKEKI